MTTVTAGTNWTITQAAGAMREITRQAKTFGYFPAMFGSTSQGLIGHDLDLFMVAVPHWNPSPEPRQWLSFFGGEIVAEFNRPDRKTRSWQVLRDGKVYHFVFAK